MNEKQMLFAYDRKRQSTLTVDSQPGAHTGANRKYIPGYADANIVFLNTSTGNDGNTGASIAQALLTYAAAATAAGSTKKIRLVNSATLSVNITKPTESTIGTTSSITGSFSTSLDTFTQAATPSFSSSTIYSIVWANKLNKFVAVGGSGKVAFSTDADTWTQSATISMAGGNSLRGICWSDELSIFIAVSSDAKIFYSSDGSSWTQVPFTGFDVLSDGLLSCIWVSELNKFFAVGTKGSSAAIAYSSDGINWHDSNNASILGVQSVTSIAYSEELGLLVAGSTSTIAHSSDGINWTLGSAAGFASDTISGITWSSIVDKFVAVGTSGVIAFSVDGITFTNSATPSFGSDDIKAVIFCPVVNKFVAAGGAGKIAFSTDGDIWTQSATPSFGSSIVLGISWSPLLSRAVAVGFDGKIGISNSYSITISNSIAGFSVSAAQISGTITFYNCSLDYIGTTAALTLDSCRVEYDSIINSNTARSTATLYRGNRYTTCTPASQNAVDMNLDTVGGTWYIHNASQTGFERIRDCLVVGGIVANYNVTVSGRANIQGDSINCLFDSQVTHNDPRFVDTTDYKLQFQTNGYARNSLAAGRSNIYFNSAGDRRDIGAWSYIESAISYYYSKSKILFKGGEITHGLEFALNEQQGDSGVVSVYGNTRRVKEVITMAYGSTQEDERDVFDYMLTLTDKTVKIQLDPEWDSNPGTVTVNGNQSAGVEFLTVDATATYSGMWLTISGKQYWVMRSSPNTTAATKLILDRPLEDAVSDNDSITRNYPSGAGEYQFAGPVNTQLKRVDANGLQGWQRGFVIRLVRKKQ